jgi:hypothetical protein
MVLLVRNSRSCYRILTAPFTSFSGYLQQGVPCPKRVPAYRLSFTKFIKLCADNRCQVYSPTE